MTMSYMQSHEIYRMPFDVTPGNTSEGGYLREICENLSTGACVHRPVTINALLTIDVGAISYLFCKGCASCLKNVLILMI